MKPSSQVEGYQRLGKTYRFLSRQVLRVPWKRWRQLTKLYDALT